MKRRTGFLQSDCCSRRQTASGEEDGAALRAWHRSRPRVVDAVRCDHRGCWRDAGGPRRCLWKMASGARRMHSSNERAARGFGGHLAAQDAGEAHINIVLAAFVPASYLAVAPLSHWPDVLSAARHLCSRGWRVKLVKLVSCELSLPRGTVARVRAKTRVKTNRLPTRIETVDLENRERWGWAAPGAISHGRARIISLFSPPFLTF